jgi:hypothetical protein
MARTWGWLLRHDLRSSASRARATPPEAIPAEWSLSASNESSSCSATQDDASALSPVVWWRGGNWEVRGINRRGRGELPRLRPAGGVPTRLVGYPRFYPPAAVALPLLLLFPFVLLLLLLINTSSDPFYLAQVKMTRSNRSQFDHPFALYYIIYAYKLIIIG